MTDPVIWTSLVLLMGAVAAMAARSSGLPSSSGALMGGALLGYVVHEAGWLAAGPDLSLLRASLTALLGFLLGAELDLARLLRERRALCGLGLIQAAAVVAVVAAAGLLLQLGGRSSLALGAACLAGSPVALIAVAAEARSRGVITARAMALAPAGLLLALVGLALVSGADGARLDAARAMAAIPAGALCGAVLLVPMSRMTARSTIVAAAMGGSLLMAAAAGTLDPGGVHLELLAPVAGFTAATLIPNRELVREALRGVALPCAVAGFALTGSRVLHDDLFSALAAACLVVAARALALFAGAALLHGPRSAALTAAAQSPISEAPAAALVAAFTVAGGTFDRMVVILLGAVFLSQVLGMPAGRWALARAGEAVPETNDDPDAWRAAMR